MIEVKEVMETQEEQKQTIPQLLEEVANKFCDGYCKYPDMWDEEVEGYELCLSEICANCPINQLI